ncbi:hypothetical protein [Arthrobacter sp.]|uniref:hypothetical protein n=1 Tax=Arthrobacter sp. TaxID=1667 RepID=UPI003A92D665
MSDMWKATADRIQDLPIEKWASFVGFTMGQIGSTGVITAADVDNWIDALERRQQLIDSRLEP